MFSKLPVRRFNEVKESAPPPGSYDPKFETDVSVPTPTKGVVFGERSISRENVNRPNTPRARTSSRDRSVSSSQPASRPSSAISTARSRSMSSGGVVSNGRANSIGPSPSPSYTISKPITQPKIMPRTLQAHKKPLDTSKQSITGKILNPSQLKTEYEQKEKEYREKLGKLEEELKQVQIQLLEESSQRQIIQEQKEAYDAAVKLLKQEVIFHETERTEWDSNEETFMETVAALKTFNEDLQLILKKQEDQFASLIEEKSSLQNSVKELEQKLRANEVEKRDIETIIGKLTEQLAESKQVQKESQSKCESLQQEMEKARQIYEEELNSMKKTQEELQKKENESSEQILNLQRNLEAMKQERTELQAKFETEIHDLKVKLRDEKMVSEKQKNHWLAAEEKYLRLVDDQKHRIEQMEGHCNELENNLFKLKEEFCEMERAKTDKEIESESLRTQLKKLAMGSNPSNLNVQPERIESDSSTSTIGEQEKVSTFPVETVDAELYAREYLMQASVEPVLSEKLSKHRQTRQKLRQILTGLQNENDELRRRNDLLVQGKKVSNVSSTNINSNIEDSTAMETTETDTVAETNNNSIDDNQNTIEENGSNKTKDLLEIYKMPKMDSISAVEGDEKFLNENSETQ